MLHSRKKIFAWTSTLVILSCVAGVFWTGPATAQAQPENPSEFTELAGVPQAPTAVDAIAGNTQAFITWQAPNQDGGAAIDGYQIEASSNGGTDWVNSVPHTHSTSTTHTVGSLTNGQSYLFRITAINADGPGPASSTSNPVVPQPAPIITSVDPLTGTDLGGASILITGQYFAGASSVTFAGTAAASFNIDSSTQISAITPAGAAGPVAVAITTPSGTTTLNNAYTYRAIPTITDIAPFYGPVSGGTSVVITGTKLTGASEVTFGGTAASAFVVNSPSQITATVPVGSPGNVDVQVVTPDGSVTEPNGFSYYDAPAITALSIESGPTTGGTSLVITGANFGGATAVTFNGTNATSFTVNSATQITASSPPKPAGAVTVAVATPGGFASRLGGFTYVSAGNPIEIVLRDKGQQQVQFHICHNLPNPTSLNLGIQIEYRIRQSDQAVAPTNAHWLQSVSPDIPYQPGDTFNSTWVPPRDMGVSTSDIVMRYRPNQNPNVTAISVPACGQNMAGVFPWFSNLTGSVGGRWEDGAGNELASGPALTPGNTYVLEATLLTTTRSSPIVHTTHRASLVTTMGGGCPLGAPDESLPVYPQMWAGLDANNRVVHVADVYSQDPWAGHPDVVSTAYTYPTWPGKTFAQVGYYFDPRTNNFGPSAVLGDIIRGGDVVSQSDMDACEDAGFEITMTVASDSSEICSISGSNVVSSQAGACNVDVTASNANVLNGFGEVSVASPLTLTRSATYIVRAGTGGSSPGSGGSGSSGSGSSGGGGSSGSSPSGANNSTLVATPASTDTGNPSQVPNRIPALPSSLTASPSLTTASTIWSLSTEQVASIPARTFGLLPPAAIRALSPEQASVLSPGQIRALAPESARALRPAVIARFTPALVAALSPDAVTSLRPATIASLSVRQLRALTPAQVSSLTKAQLRKLSTRQLSALKPVT